MSDGKGKTNLNLNKSKSWENIREKKPRQAKKIVNYKESRTYNRVARVTNSDNADFSNKSLITPKPSTHVQTETVPSTSSFYDKNLTEPKQLSSPNTENSEDTILNREIDNTGNYSNRESETSEQGDLLSSRLQENPECPLKTPIKATNVSELWENARDDLLPKKKSDSELLDLSNPLPPSLELQQVLDVGVQTSYYPFGEDTPLTRNITTPPSSSPLRGNLESPKSRRNNILSNFDPFAPRNSLAMEPMSSETYKCLKKCFFFQIFRLRQSK